MNLNHKAVYVPEGTFRSRLVPVAAICCAAAAVCALVSVFALFLSGNFRVIQVPLSSTVEGSAHLTWILLHCSFIVASYLCSLLLGASLLHAVRGKVQDGMDLLGRGMRLMRLCLTGIAAVAALYFIYRLVRYSVYTLGHDFGIMFLLPTLLAELLMGALAALIFVALRRFLDAAGNTAASIARTITSGVLRAPSISQFSAVGFLLLGAVNLILAVTRFVAFAEWSAAANPAAAMLTVAALMYLFAGVACVLLFVYLRSYKQKSEYLLYKGTPVEEETV